MRKTKKAYEEYLNGIYSGKEAREIGRYMYHGRSFANCICLLDKGKYGTALRRYDHIAFEVGYEDWDIDKAAAELQEMDYRRLRNLSDGTL